MPDTPIDYLHFAGGEGRGKGKGKKIVLLAGNDEYRSEKSLLMWHNIARAGEE